jgi:hypothetical protein
VGNIEQVAFATVAKYQNRTVVATFEKPTKPGSLLVAVDSTAGTIPSRVSTPNGFTSALASGLRDVQMNVWYRPNAPATSQVSCTALDDNKSHQLRVFEVSGMAQTAVLDKISFRSNEDRDPTTGDSGVTSQADEVVFAFVTNQYASTSQTSFAGGFTRLYETVSPQRWSGGTNQDWERSRQSVHVAFPNTTKNFHLWCDLDTTRRWIAAVLTFKSGVSGPLKMSSTVAPEGMKTGVEKAQMGLFGPLVSKADPCAMTTGVERARIGPFNYQYRIGGWAGLLIGSGTQFHVESTQGMGGWDVRTSDDDLPRGDGALRGIDLQEAREIVFKMNVGKGRLEVERNMAALYRALRIQRDTDIELLFRLPTYPLQMLRCRPIALPRLRSGDQIQFAEQSFTLRAADPRIYAAVPKTVQIPVTPTVTGDPLLTQVVNDGNSEAYPIIRIEGPTFGPPVTRIQLVNETALVAFEAELTIPSGSVLIADMDARIRGTSDSPITLDGQTKYGAWQLPREPFRIDPDPTGFGGYNSVYLRTEPANAAIECTLEYRDTWAG